ncbi:MAG TPA: hypothetical protein VLD39_06770, partial [Gammaproteobacteria bacterium]|nr:hypothetical protein [Gammaproteobacteria bacterium]
EALAFADTISSDIDRTLGPPAVGRGPLSTGAERVSQPSVVALKRIEAWTRLLRHIMWEQVGIVRTRAGLAEATEEIAALEAALEREWPRQELGCAALEFRNMLTVASLVARSAQLRQESRGLHFISDFPRASREPYDTALQPF